MKIKSYGEYIKLDIDSRYSPLDILNLCIAKSAKYSALVGKTMPPHVFVSYDNDDKTEYVPESKLFHICQLLSSSHNGLRYNYMNNLSNSNLENNEEDRNIDIKCSFYNWSL